METTRRGVLVWAASAIAVAAAGDVLAVGAPAQATTDTYPYKTSDSNKMDPWGFNFRNCTSYCAWKINEAGFKNANGATFINTYKGDYAHRFGDATNWATRARALGWVVSSYPQAHAVAQTTAGEAGHVAWVESANSDGSAHITEYNSAHPLAFDENPSRVFPSYIFVPGVTANWAVAKYAGFLVQWSGDTKSQKTCWYVTPDLRRLWVPDTSTFNYLRSRGAPGPAVLSSAQLAQLPDQTNKWAPNGAQLTGNRTLRRGMSIKSGDGRYTFVLQSDGNLVLYGPSGRALWASHTGTSQYVVFQGDGNLVAYTDAGKPVWASGTGGSGGNRLVVQNDGNVVIYSPARAVWATNTAGKS